jgi:hypothetical protein
MQTQPAAEADSDRGGSHHRDHPTMRTIVLAFVSAAALAPPQPAHASSPDFNHVITFGATREQIKNTPILDRPYRPLHVYGNTVRRRNHRGAAAPSSRTNR